MKKKIYTYFLIHFLLFFISLSSFATIYNDNGTTTSYHLYNGDILNINSGTFTGSILTFEQGALIRVTENAAFKPRDIQQPHGKIVNIGLTFINFPFNPLEHFNLENFGLFILQRPTITAGSQVWTNKFGGTIESKKNMEFNAGVQFSNNGYFAVEESLLVNANTVLENNYHIEVKGNISFNGGTNINRGSISTKSSLYFNKGENNFNHCRFIAAGNMENNQSLINDGFIWVKESGMGKKFTNAGYGVLTLMPNSIIKTVDFTNYSSISGSGDIYSTGNTWNSGIVGSASSSAPINIYDATRSNPSKLFDQDWGTVHPNAKYSTLPAPDDDFTPAGCSDLYSTKPLPLLWKQVHVSQKGQRIIINWSAAFQEGNFLVETSSNGKNFVEIAYMPYHLKEEYEYQYTLKATSSTIHYRIKHISNAGKETYSEIKKLIFEVEKKIGLSLYPNPTHGNVSILFHHDKKELLQLMICDINGKVICTRSVEALTGNNFLVFKETETLGNGIYIAYIKKEGAVLHMQKFIKN